MLNLYNTDGVQIYDAGNFLGIIQVYAVDSLGSSTLLKKCLAPTHSYGIRASLISQGCFWNRATHQPMKTYSTNQTGRSKYGRYEVIYSCFCPRRRICYDGAGLWHRQWRQLQVQHLRRRQHRTFSPVFSRLSPLSDHYSYLLKSSGVIEASYVGLISIMRRVKRIYRALSSWKGSQSQLLLLSPRLFAAYNNAKMTVIRCRSV